MELLSPWMGFSHLCSPGRAIYAANTDTKFIMGRLNWCLCAAQHQEGGEEQSRETHAQRGDGFLVSKHKPHHGTSVRGAPLHGASASHISLPCLVQKQCQCPKSSRTWQGTARGIPGSPVSPRGAPGNSETVVLDEGPSKAPVQSKSCAIC